MPKKVKSTATDVVVEGAEAVAKKKRDPPKPQPPVAIVRRIAKRHAPNKAIRGPVYKLLRDVAVEYAQNVYAQIKAIHENYGSKTLTYKDLQTLAKVSHTAGTTPQAQGLTELAAYYLEKEASSESALKKKAAREAKKLADKEIKTAAAAAIASVAVAAVAAVASVADIASAEVATAKVAAAEVDMEIQE